MEPTSSDPSPHATIAPAVGDRYVNVNAELDLDHCSRERTTAPGHEWRVADVQSDYVTIVCDATGAAINPTYAELFAGVEFVKLRPSSGVLIIEPRDFPRWQRVDAYIAQMSISPEDVSVDFTSANFHSDGLNVNGLVDLFVPAHVYR
ncbi:hypothetical protein C8E08_4947 [Paracidovorax citrulli]|uniref:Uncharacterized protein n=1 Tax=Paracidovorax citrulli (strain AAC00-1) TaxID=397945 RepID=A1TQN0_PARC0|nr:hypothetical protein [Paracidovorax citrulli]ABM33268.1 hypothetical protein Aave_2698 [Paracidovorax citrulli AAC00-1]PVY67501.1 hypothetical protein C8E08_4947 [Paracidovorax citrulli]REG68339.1 hypothetical protein C8E07_1444 [Paracidovorax citrulli]RLJ92897.1 hypothetical protein C8E06_1445 [Paracidovorax citrulli]UMT83216.1 hypothetical protein FRC75_07425 [Paracidovorax citrulli]